jgi:hypothetical protein
VADPKALGLGDLGITPVQVENWHPRMLAAKFAKSEFEAAY